MNPYCTQVGDRLFNPLAPFDHHFDLQAAVSALSKVCRFNGHTTEFYSVAQHMVLTSVIVESSGGSRAEQRNALFHDLAEAYTQDMIQPLKALAADTAPLFMARMNTIERAVEAAFGFEHTALVKQADLEALAYEHRMLIPQSRLTAPLWAGLPAVGPLDIPFLSPKEAEATWWKRCAQIGA